MSIDKVVNQHMADGGTAIATSTSSTASSSASHKNAKTSSTSAVGEKTRVGNREVHTLVAGNNHSKRGRGRPRLTEEEKMRRRELRDMGLMKRSKRRTKEGTPYLQYMYYLFMLLIRGGSMESRANTLAC